MSAGGGDSRFDRIRAAEQIENESQIGSTGSALVYRYARPRKSLTEILSEIQQCADQTLAQASTLPAEAYTSEDFYQWEVENIFRKEWLCLAHVSQIPEIGDFLNTDLLGEPLIVVRGKDEEIRVLSRVCPHRAMDIMPFGFGYDGHGPADAKEGKPGCGHTRLFLCPYHTWTFELDGRLKACPENIWQKTSNEIFSC